MHRETQISSGIDERGFTAVELVGVLAIVTILVSLAAPAVIRQIDEAVRAKESTELGEMRKALIKQIVTTKTIPHETAMAQAVATWTRQPVGKISTNPRGYNRAFLLDTSGWFGSHALPFAQTNTGTTRPLSARVMIVSSIARALPVSTGRPSAAAFNNIWNTPDASVPSGWTTWAGRGEDLFIERVNLEPTFHRLVVINRDRFGVVPPTMSVDTTNTFPVLLTNAVDAFYLDGSVVGLCDEKGTPFKRLTLTNDFGFVFEGGIWREGISGGESSEVMAKEFTTLAAKFLAAQWYPGAEQGGRTGTQQGAVTAMFNLMLVYGLWANPFPHFNRHGANAQQVPEYVLLDDIVGAGVGNNASGFLNVFTGPNGLLNN